ncbi:MAG: T9SS type A sorting domain-containing protein, partial [Anaerolineales bacterium]
YCQVHNFSLLPTPGPVDVRFYVGNPDSGGTLIVGEGGISEVYTGGIIPPGGTKEVELQWRVPSGIGVFPRIYAEIDADNNVTEIHENNNKSWATLQKSDYTSIPDDDDYFVPDEFKLAQNYPNPFNPKTMINYQLQISSKVELTVYNLLGQKVITLVNENQSAGFHQLEWDASNYGSGVYYYQLKAGEYRAVRKMILLK